MSARTTILDTLIGDIREDNAVTDFATFLQGEKRLNLVLQELQKAETAGHDLETRLRMLEIFSAFPGILDYRTIKGESLIVDEETFDTLLELASLRAKWAREAYKAHFDPFKTDLDTMTTRELLRDFPKNVVESYKPTHPVRAFAFRIVTETNMSRTRETLQDAEDCNIDAHTRKRMLQIFKFYRSTRPMWMRMPQHIRRTLAGTDALKRATENFEKVNELVERWEGEFALNQATETP